jgi:hypothetical protein
MHQLRRELGKSFRATFARATLDREVLAFDVSSALRPKERVAQLCPAVKRIHSF